MSEDSFPILKGDALDTLMRLNDHDLVSDEFIEQFQRRAPEHLHQELSSCMFDVMSTLTWLLPLLPEGGPPEDMLEDMPLSERMYLQHTADGITELRRKFGSFKLAASIMGLAIVDTAEDMGIA